MSSFWSRPIRMQTSFTPAARLFRTVPCPAWVMAGRFLEHALMSRGAALPRSALAVRLSMLPSC